MAGLKTDDKLERIKVLREEITRLRTKVNGRTPRLKTIRCEAGGPVERIVSLREEEATEDMQAKGKSLYERLGHTIGVMRKGGSLNSSDMDTLKDVQNYLGEITKDDDTAAREDRVAAYKSPGTKQLTESMFRPSRYK